MSGNRIQLMRSQWLIHKINANVTYCTWMRAGGKTTGGIATRFDRLSNVMPRAQVLFYTDTFERIHDKLIPSVEMFWQNDLGLIDGVDYVKYRKPPDHFIKSLVPLNKYDHVISFATGLSICGASQKVEGSANGYNAQALIVDETKYIREKKINTEVLPALRGLQHIYGHLPEYGSQWYFTDKWGHHIKWILGKRKLVKKKVVDSVLLLQLEIDRLYKLLADAELNKIILTEAEKGRYNRRIYELETNINKVRRSLVFYSDAKPYENRMAVPKQFFADRKRDLTDYEYRVAILNEDPDRAEYHFYPTFTDDNLYEIADESDVQRDKSLIISLDYNWRISPLVIAQEGKLPGAMYDTVNILRAMHTKAPEGIAEVIKKFCDHYRYMNNRVVQYVFDHTAIGNDPARDSFKDVVKKELYKHGWYCVDVYIGKAPDHDIKYERIKKILLMRGDGAVMMNELTCEYLLKYIYQAGVINTSNKTHKDKRYEKDPNYPPEEATDYSDAFDSIPWAYHELKLLSYSSSVPAMGHRMS